MGSFYNSGDFVELIIRDYSGTKIEVFKWNMQDKDLERRLFNRLKSKYGLFQFDKKDKDLDWLNNNE